MLQALLASIPNFWSSADLTLIADLYLEATTSLPQSRTAQIWTLVKSVTKRVPSKTLVPVLCDFWTGLVVQGDVSRSQSFTRPLLSVHNRLLH